MLDDREVVEQRFHVGIQLGLDIAGEEADVFIAERYNRAGHEDLAVAFFPL